jgi:ligand-binding sensor domain-containing protein
MNTWKALLFLAFLFSCLGQLSAQEWTSFKSIQKSNDFIDTGDELLLATDAGLAIVDKGSLEYSIFDRSNTNLSNDHIQSIDLSSSGEVFIGTYDVVVARFNGSDFYDHVIPDGIDDLDHIVLYDLKVSESDEIWLATSEGVFRQSGSEWIKYDLDDLGVFFLLWGDIEFDETGQVYLATGNGVFKFEDDTWTNISTEMEFSHYLPADIHFSQEGDLFLAGSIDHIARFDGEDWTIYSDIGLSPSEHIVLSEDSEGNIYCTSGYNGIYKLEGDSWELVVDEQTDLYADLYSDWISFYHIDEDGTRWLSSGIYLSVKKNNELETLTLSTTSIETNQIHNIMKGSDGTIYFLMLSPWHNIATLSPDGEWSYLDIPLDEASYYFGHDILVRDEDDMYISFNQGVYHYDGLEWTFYPVGPCQYIVEDTQGKVYFKGIDKLHVVENGVLSTYDSSNSPIYSGLKVSAIGVDAEDYLWIGAHDVNTGFSVVFKVSPEGEWTTYDESVHPSIKLPRGEFHFDANGDVLVLCSGGLLRYDGQDFTNMLEGNPFGFQSQFIYMMDSDAEGRVYFATDIGLITYYEGQWEEFINDNIPILSGSSWWSSISVDDSGTVWWGNGNLSDGVYSFVPADLTNTHQSSQDADSKISLYPNPTHSETTIKYSVVEEAEVSIAIYNKLGQRISLLDLGFLHKGYHEKELNLSNYPAGMYLVQLRQGKHTSITKLIID